MTAERRGDTGSSNACSGRADSVGRHIGADGALSRGDGTADGTSGAEEEEEEEDGEADTGGGVAIDDQSRGSGVGPGVVGAEGRAAAGPFGARGRVTIGPGGVTAGGVRW
jgi:hypothetical protein